jgi:hypothetical protein
MNGYAFSPTGWYATFDQTRSPGGVLQARVEAWSPDGAALVVDPTAGRLVPATAVAGFAELRPCRRVVSVIPAAPGWRVHHVDDSGSYNSTVVGFAVAADGEGLPVVAHPLGTDAEELSRPSPAQLSPDEADPETPPIPAVASQYA